MSTAPLHLMHLRPDPQQLVVWAAKHRLLDKSGDLGYALHGLFRAALGAHAPRSFRYLDADQGLLAYTTLNSAELQEQLALAPADVVAALGLGATAQSLAVSVRAFPTQWPSGHVLGFDVRVRPVMREGKTGHERDAFLLAAESANGAAIDRGLVYVEWLRQQLARQGGAELIDASLDRFQLLDVMRMTQKASADAPRRRHVVSGPDAVLVGHLRVADPAAFADLLARGIGRHRAFGFGLLLLRPARR